MTTLQITCFLKVADTMSFSKAADELYVSQPSVSRHVRQLEEELGFSLFERTNRNNVTLTPEGMVFRDCFRRSLLGYEQAVAAAREVSGQDMLHVNIGIGEGWDLTEELLAYRDAVKKRYPQSVIRISSEPFQALHESLLRREKDVILCTRTSLQNFNELEVAEIAQFEGRAYARKGTFCPEERPLTIGDFQNAALLHLPESEAPMSEQIIKLQFQALQVKIDSQELLNRSSIYQSILMGDGFGVFDQHVSIGKDPRVTSLRLTEQIPICAVWYKNNQNPLVRLFAEVMSQRLSGELN